MSKDNKASKNKNSKNKNSKKNNKENSEDIMKFLKKNKLYIGGAIGVLFIIIIVFVFVLPGKKKKDKSKTKSSKTQSSKSPSSKSPSSKSPSSKTRQIQNYSPSAWKSYLESRNNLQYDSVTGPSADNCNTCQWKMDDWCLVQDATGAYKYDEATCGTEDSKDYLHCKAEKWQYGLPPNDPKVPDCQRGCGIIPGAASTQCNTNTKTQISSTIGNKTFNKFGTILS